MGIDLTSFSDAINSLRSAIEAYSNTSLPDGSVEKETMRDGVIQRFEYTFELSWKMLKRYLQMYGLERSDTLTAKELFRIGCEQGMLDKVEAWFDYHLARNKTSHTYNRVIAEGVYEVARLFVNDAQFLLDRLKEKAK